jgi:hypothetical protein
MVPHPIPSLLLVGLLAGGLSGGLADDRASAPPGATEDGYDRVVRPLLDRHGCTPVGFDDVEGEHAALVRTPGGRLRVVSVAHGRAVYDGTRPGVLVGVCTGRP